MDILPDKYCGDKTMSEYLRQAGAKLSIFELYGLLYGCLTAPNLVMPSHFYPLLFGKEGGDFESEEKVNAIIGNLMSLWNLIAQWRPKTDPFIFPDAEYPTSGSGMVQHLKDNYSLIAYFIKGLDLGGTQENDFSEEGLSALKSLSEAQVFFDKYGELLNKEGDDDINKTIESIHGLENIVADCIARISIDLKPARMQVADEMSTLHEAKKKASWSKSTKTSRNEPCPCGSGKKYKKCCGLTH